MSFASQVKYSRLTDLDADDGSTTLEINGMKGNPNFSFDSIYTYEDDRKSNITGHSVPGILP